MKKPYVVFLIFLIISFIFSTEFVILPFVLGVPRDIFLMGFYAEGKIIDGVVINKMGFTGDFIKLRKVPGTIRILTLGGSAMFNRCMAERLKKKFKTVTNRHIEILGAALRCHTSMSSIHKYKLLSKYNFDYVLIYDGINDLWANHVYKNDFKTDYSQLEPWYRRNFLLNRSIIWRILYNKFIYKLPKERDAGAAFESIKTFANNIEYLIDLIRQDRACPVLMTTAWYIPKNYSIQKFERHELGYNNPDRYDEFPVEQWGSVEYVRKGITQINDVIHTLASKKKIFIINQEKLIGENIKYFGDICHLSNEGTDKFIENIIHFFIENKLLE